MTAKKSGPVSGVTHTGVCVSFLVFDESGRMAVHKRGTACRDEVGRWDSGSGECEFGEDPQDAARREIRQELGLDNVTLIPVTTRSVVRDIVGPKKQPVKTHWLCVVFAALVGEVKPALTPAPEEQLNVLYPLWLFPENLELLPLHSQTKAHTDAACAVLRSSALLKHPDRQKLIAEERGEMFRRMAQLPGAALLVEKAIAEMAAEASAVAKEEAASEAPATPEATEAPTTPAA